MCGVALGLPDGTGERRSIKGCVTDTLEHGALQVQNSTYQTVFNHVEIKIRSLINPCVDTLSGRKSAVLTGSKVCVSEEPHLVNHLKSVKKLPVPIPDTDHCDQNL